MEIMGLAIIVLIITIAMFFIITRVITKPPIEEQRKFAEIEISANMLNAMLKSVTECQGLSITELLQDCGNWGWPGSISCDYEGLYLGSCEYAESVIDDIMFNSTLKEWKYPYFFTVFTTDPGNPLIYLNENQGLAKECHDLEYARRNNIVNLLQREKPGIQPLPLETGTMTVKLAVCKRV